jgi:hypothetical protein
MPAANWKARRRAAAADARRPLPVIPQPRPDGVDEPWISFMAALGEKLFSFANFMVQSVQSMALHSRIRHNERVRRNACGLWPYCDDVEKLLEHPKIGCRWNPSPGQRPINTAHADHGQKMAVAWSDMRLPMCRGCMVEDPYE